MFERARQIIKTKQAAPPLNLSPVPTHIMRVAGIEICLLLDLWSAQRGIPATATAVRTPADSPNLKQATELVSVAFFYYVLF